MQALSDSTTARQAECGAPPVFLGYPEYWKAAMKMTKKGSMIIGDNVVRQGRIADAENKDE